MWTTRALSGSVTASWALFLLLTWLHIYANIRAMRCLTMASINLPRALLLMDAALRSESLPHPADLAPRETLLFPLARQAFHAGDPALSLPMPIAGLDSVCRRVLHRLLGLWGSPVRPEVLVGDRPSSALAAAGPRGTIVLQRHALAFVPDAFGRMPYGPCAHETAAAETLRRPPAGPGRLHVILHHEATPQDELRAVAHAAAVAARRPAHDAFVPAARAAWKEVASRWPEIERELGRCGWALDRVRVCSTVWRGSWAEPTKKRK